MASDSYWEKLRDPRWQQKRLKVMEAAEFTCEDCGAEDKTLTVHHSFYEYGLEPWEYPDESLHCLCEECHKRAQALYQCIKRQLGALGLGDTEVVLGFMWGMQAAEFPMTVIPVGGYEFAEGVAKAWWLTAEQVIAALDEDKTINGYTLATLRGHVRLRQKAIAALPPSLPAPNATPVEA
jgi:hypothetical protein